MKRLVVVFKKICVRKQTGGEKSMKKIINSLLWIGTLISIIVVLKYSSLPIPSFLPENLQIFWITSAFERDKYSLLYDICVGFLLSALFYFVVEEIPDIVRIKKSKILIAPYINQINENMEQIINVVIDKYSCNKKIKELSQKDFLILDGETQQSLEEISYNTHIYYKKSNKVKMVVHQYNTIDKLIKTNLKNILDNIIKIKKYEYFYGSNAILVECIRRIEQSELIRYYYIDNDTKKNSLCFLIHGTSKAIIEFIDLYSLLLKLNYHTEYTMTTLDTKEETQKYHENRENGVFIKEIIDLQTEKRKRTKEMPTAIISGSKYTTKILVSQLKKTIDAEYLPIDCLMTDDLERFKNVAVVVDSLSINDIISFLKERNLQSHIVLIIENKLFSRELKSTLKTRNIKVIYFKSLFRLKILNLIINKDEPSEKTIFNISKKLEKEFYDEP